VRGVGRFLGFAGLVLLVFGLLSFALTQRFDLWTAIHVAGGGLLVVVSGAANLAGVRRTVARRGTRERAQALLGALLFAAILVAGNVLAARFPWRYDATESKIHTLAPATRALVRNLSTPVELFAVFQPADAARREIEPLLRRLAEAGPKLTWRFVDPDREALLVRQLGVTQDKVVVARAGETIAQSAGDARAGIGEGALANLLMRVTRKGPRTVYVVIGDGEPSPEDLQDPGGLGLLARALTDANFAPKPLLLSTQQAVPGDARLVVLAAPRKPLPAHDVELLRQYMGKGGRLLVLVDPGEELGLTLLLGEYGVTLGDTLVVDQQQVPFFGARLGVDPIVESFPEHPITKGFRERIVLLQARTVDWAASPAASGAQGQVIAETGDESWAESGWREALANGRVRQDPGEEEGPLGVAVAATKGESRLVAVGDADFARNANLDTYFNREFLLNAVQWLAGEDELIAERPRGLRPSRLEMTDLEMWRLFRFSVLLLPEALLIVGLGIWWRRRTL
jgi:ABC-type uncharacterized transport system involved in gliding motility auxiliary subunit